MTAQNQYKKTSLTIHFCILLVITLSSQASDERVIGNDMPELPNIACQVFDAQTRKPIPHARVTQATLPLKIDDFTRWYHFKSDQEGKAEIPVNHPNFSIMVHAEGYIPQEHPMPISKLENNQGPYKFYLTPNFQKRLLHIKDPQGQPIAGAKVYLFPFLRKSLGYEQAPVPLETFDQKVHYSRLNDLELLGTSTSSEQGIAAFSTQGYPILSLAIAKEGYESARHTLTFLKMGDMEQVILKPTKEYRGRITDDKGRPVAKVLIQYTQSEHEGIQLKDTYSDADGKYSLHTAYEDVTVTFTKIGHQIVNYKGHPKKLKKTIMESGPVHLIQINDPQGNPIKDVAIFAIFKEEFRPTFTLSAKPHFYTNSKGISQIPGTNGQKLTVILKKLGYPWQTYQINAHGTKSVLTYRPLAPLSGHTLDIHGKPVANVLVRMIRTNPDKKASLYNDYDLNNLKTLSAADGSFHFKGVPSGTIELRTQRPNYVVAKTSIQNFEATPQEGIKLRLKPSVKLRGKVADPKGNPIRNVWVKVLMEDGHTDKTLSRSDGTFKFAGLPRGFASIICEKAPGFQGEIDANEHTTTLKLGTNTLDLILNPKPQ